MLAVWLFIVFWVLVAIALFYVASRGGLRIGDRSRRREPGRLSRLGFNTVLIVIYIGFGIVLPFLILHGNNVNASAKVAGVRLNSQEKAGRELFAEHCGVCHTLAEAHAIGKVGPNLDQLRPSYGLIIHTLQYGCLASPPSPTSPESCLGQGNMPSDILEGQAARDVAEFVARVAGRE
jgi:cytochrome c553